MKVAILTIHAAHNYGAMLQAYALASSIQKLGHDVVVIDYRPVKIDESNRLLAWKPSLTQLARNAAIIARLPTHRKRHARFESFRKEMLPLTPVFRSEAELAADLPEADRYIVGSDQIWNPQRGLMREFFLGFVPSHKITASYAASIGIDHIPDIRAAEMRELLQNIKHLSVREDSAVDLISHLTGRPVHHVMDPVFLLSRSEWLKVAPPVRKRNPYALVYTTEFGPRARECVRAVKEHTDLEIVVMGVGLRNRFGISCEFARDAGPLEFVALVEGADLVITNSFHGTAFAAMFNKPLVCIAHSTRNARMESLLRTLGWESRMVTSASGVKAALESHKNGDLSVPRIESAVCLSINFIESCLRYDETHEARI